MSDSFNDIFNRVEPIEEEPVEQEVQEELVEEQHDEEPEVVESEDEHQADPEDLGDEIDDEHDEELPVAKKGVAPVPLPTFLDMRDKYKAEKAAREANERAFEEYKSRQQVAVEPATIDPFVNPQEFVQQIRSEMEQTVLNERLVMSHQLALQKHDPDTVRNAVEWAKAQAVDPKFEAAMSRNLDPIEFAVQQHKEATEFDEFKRDPKGYAKKLGEQEGWFKPATAEVVAVDKPAKKVARSLTNISSTVPGKKSTSGQPTQDFDAIFNPKR